MNSMKPAIVEYKGISNEKFTNGQRYEAFFLEYWEGVRDSFSDYGPMSTFSEKLRILRKNKEWTQAQLADALSVSESTVQKWEVDKNAPPVSEIKRLAEVFYLPATSLIDDAVDIPEFIYLESIPAEDFYPRNAALDSTSHKVYDAGLKNYANLHRFLNKAGEPYSAIYVGRDERLSCERDHEQGMIDYWNQG